ncbi:MAG: Dabb family protein [Isosphaeraceae bacterium]|nr:Dabb family protein [Isosphaeraceae bacterium]
MKQRIARVLLPALAALLVAGALARSADKPGPPLAHMVFFTLKDRSPQARQKLVAACQKYLSGHEGAIYFSVGTVAEDALEAISDRDFDVALHLVFEDKAAEAKYLKDPRHQKFVAENRESWSKVRVFDSYLAAPGK